MTLALADEESAVRSFDNGGDYANQERTPECKALLCWRYQRRHTADDEPNAVGAAPGVGDASRAHLCAAILQGIGRGHFVVDDGDIAEKLDSFGLNLDALERVAFPFGKRVRANLILADGLRIAVRPVIASSNAAIAMRFWICRLELDPSS